MSRERSRRTRRSRSAKRWAARRSANDDSARADADGLVRPAGGPARRSPPPPRSGAAWAVNSCDARSSSMPGPAVVAQRLEQLVAGRAALACRRTVEHRALGEPRQQVEHVAAGQTDLGSGEIERSGEHRQRGEQLLLVGLEQVVGPADRVVHRPVARVAAAAHRLQQPEALVEPAGDLGDAERPRPGRGQLDRERDAVEPSADLDDDRCGPGVEHERGIGGAGPLDEQRHRGDRGGLGVGVVLGAGGGERFDRPHLLAGTASGSRLVARTETDRRFAQDPADERRDRLDQVLAVVEDAAGRAAAAASRRSRRRSSCSAAGCTSIDGGERASVASSSTTLTSSTT